MSVHHFTIVVLTVCALCGCGDPNQNEATRALSVGNSEGAACATRIDANPQYRSIAPYMPLGGGPATDIQLDDTALFEPSLAPVVAAWRSDLVRCRLSTIATAQVAAPTSVQVLLAGYESSDAVLDAFVSGRMTWGEANQQRDAIAAAGAENLQIGVAYQIALLDAAQSASATETLGLIGNVLGDIAIGTLEGMAEGASGYSGGRGHSTASRPSRTGHAQPAAGFTKPRRPPE
jgi:hypothetical protein